MLRSKLRAKRVVSVLTTILAWFMLTPVKILDVPQSGSVAGVTSSRNRYGQYRRSRATPVNPNSPAQGQVRARMAASAALWRTLTDAQRAGWESLGATLTRTDALGHVYSLNGFSCFCSVNNGLAAMGSAQVLDAPANTTPEALLTGTLTVTAAAMSLAYTDTPLGAGAKLFVFASPQRSAGRQYEGDLRLIHTSAAAAASPANIKAGYDAKFGVPVVGNKIFVSAIVMHGGFASGPLLTSAIVTA